MRHSKRTTLTTDDVDSALSLRNVEVSFVFHWDFPALITFRIYSQ